MITSSFNGGNSDTQQGVLGSETTKPVQTLDEEPEVVPMGIPKHIKDMELEGLIPGFKVAG